MSVIYLAGGCFWGVQKYFDQFEGIIKTIVGYANGRTENPKYEDVKAGKTGHVETVKIEYDESLRSLNQILDDYYKIIDPTSLNKQGEDEGISYRTGIYYTNESDLEIIQNKSNNFIRQLYIRKENKTDTATFEMELQKAVGQLQKTYPFLSVKNEGEGLYLIDIPLENRSGHEEHFGKVAKSFLHYLKCKDMPDWENENTISKYYITTTAVEMAHK